MIVGELIDEHCKLEATNRVLALQQDELERQLENTKKAKAELTTKLENALLGNISTENLDPFDWFINACGCAANTTAIEQHVSDDWSTAPVKGNRPSREPAPSALETWKDDPTPTHYYPSDSFEKSHRRPMGLAN